MRIRTIKPAFWSNEKISQLPEFTRLLAIGLLNYADDHGYFWANCLMVRGALFPFEEDSTKVRRGLAQLEAIGYEALGATPDGREAGHVIKFSTHQRVDKAQASQIAPLITFQERSKNVPLLILEESPLERKGKEGKGKDPNLAAPPAPRARNELLDALCLHAELTDPSSAAPALWSKLAMALKEIKGATPDVTAVDIGLRAQNYRSHFRDATISATALAKHWGRCAAEAPVAKSANAPVPWQRDSHNSDHEKGF